MSVLLLPRAIHASRKNLGGRATWTPRRLFPDNRLSDDFAVRIGVDHEAALGFIDDFDADGWRFTGLVPRWIDICYSFVRNPPASWESGPTIFLNLPRRDRHDMDRVADHVDGARFSPLGSRGISFGLVSPHSGTAAQEFPVSTKVR
jgi:hypothetical protein